MFGSKKLLRKEKNVKKNDFLIFCFYHEKYEIKLSIIKTSWKLMDF